MLEIGTINIHIAKSHNGCYKKSQTAELYLKNNNDSKEMIEVLR
jgi:hypothetical protein